MREHDLIVIGAGSGLDVAQAAGQRGMDVAVVEKGPLGGTCLNRGCIPSKMLIHHADVIETIRTADKFSIDAELTGHDFKSITREVNEKVGADADANERAIRDAESQTLYDAECRFVDDRTIEVAGERVRSEKVVVAAGARPTIPPVDGLDEVEYLTSEEALKLDEQPDRLVIIGGGYIAAELGYFYGALGTDVTVIGRSELLLPNEDKDVAQTFTDVFSQNHEVHVDTEATAVSESNGEITVTAETGDGEEITATGDALLVATGRRPNTDLLDVETAGIETDENGFVESNEYLETTADGVWTLGDIAGNYLFKHSANHEAEYVYRNAVLGKHVPVDYTGMSHAIFSQPQVAGMGKTEAEVADEGVEYETATHRYDKVAMGQALKEEDGFVKVIADATDGAILGCHIIGPDASVLIHEAAIAAKSGSGTVDDISNTIHIHPALNEVVDRAFAKL